MKIQNKKKIIITILLISIIGVFTFYYIKSTTLKNLVNVNSKEIHLNNYYSIINTSSKEYKVIRNDTSEVVIPEYIISYKIVDSNIYLKQSSENNIEVNYWGIYNDKITGPLDKNTFQSIYNVNLDTFENIIH